MVFESICIRQGESNSIAVKSHKTDFHVFRKLISHLQGHIVPMNQRELTNVREDTQQSKPSQSLCIRLSDLLGQFNFEVLS